jgi:hypothetical protein
VALREISKKRAADQGEFGELQIFRGDQTDHIADELAEAVRRMSRV